MYILIAQCLCVVVGNCNAATSYTLFCCCCGCVVGVATDRGCDRLHSLNTPHTHAANKESHGQIMASSKSRNTTHVRTLIEYKYIHSTYRGDKEYH